MLKTAAAAAAAILTLTAATSAFAAGVMTATLEKAVDKPQTYVSPQVIWRCLGTTCATTSDLSTTDSKSACRKLVKSAGAVAAFNTPKGPVTGADLAACNG